MVRNLRLSPSIFRKAATMETIDTRKVCSPGPKRLFNLCAPNLKSSPQTPSPIPSNENFLLSAILKKGKITKKSGPKQ